MYCSNRPKQKGYTIEELFPDELFPAGNKQKSNDMFLLYMLYIINPFYATGLFPYAQKTSNNPRFFMFSEDIKKRPVACTGLIIFFFLVFSLILFMLLIVENFELTIWFQEFCTVQVYFVDSSHFTLYWLLVKISSFFILYFNFVSFTGFTAE